jgi:predicted metal-dependent HD superfamily phosphohydrolase
MENNNEGQDLNVIDLAKDHVFEIFKNGKIKNLVYHNYNHTIEVVKSATKLAELAELSPNDEQLLLLAAWFHDTGYAKKYLGHEPESANFAAEFMEQNAFSKEEIEIVKTAILGTVWPQKPTSLIGQLLCDADMSHFGSKSYFDKSELLRLEWELTDNFPSEFDWPSSEIKFLTEHNYFTPVAEKEYTKKKQKNILKLKEIQDQLLISEEEAEVKENKAINKKKTPERGIETMFRVTYANHMSLSAIADNKANIMLSINAIIISICLSTLIPNFDDNAVLIIPTTTLILVCVTTIIFATLSTRPKISKGTFTRDDIMLQKPNLLFFGNFHGMDMTEFEWGMEELMKSKDYLYSSMIRDIYSLGSVLAKKYKYLRICYGVFMWGMITSVLVFMISLIL